MARTRRRPKPKTTTNATNRPNAATRASMNKAAALTTVRMIVGYDTQPWTASLSSLRLLAVAEMQKDKNFTAIEKRSEVMVAVTMADKLAITMKNYRACMPDDEEYKAAHVKLVACSMLTLDLLLMEIKALTQVTAAADAKRNEQDVVPMDNSVTLEDTRRHWAAPVPGSVQPTLPA